MTTRLRELPRFALCRVFKFQPSGSRWRAPDGVVGSMRANLSAICKQTISTAIESEMDNNGHSCGVVHDAV
eukprot:scaffold193991_cov35-Prasinocladus_malaysianus.AAC.1